MCVNLILLNHLTDKYVILLYKCIFFGCLVWVRSAAFAAAERFFGVSSCRWILRSRTLEGESLNFRWLLGTHLEIVIYGSEGIFFRIRVGKVIFLEKIN